MEDMATGNDRFTEKLKKLTDRRGFSKSRLAAEAGTSPQAIQRYFEGAAPRLHTAIALANALGVDPVWLFDEDEPWRDDFPQSPAASISDEAIMQETARRYAAAERRLVKIIEEAESIPWPEISARIAKGGGDDDVVYAALTVALTLFHIVRSSIDVFDSVRQADVELKITRDYGRWLPEADSPRRQAMLSRINGILEKLGSAEGSEQAFLSHVQKHPHMMLVGDPEAAFGNAEGALFSYQHAAKREPFGDLTVKPRRARKPRGGQS